MIAFTPENMHSVVKKLLTNCGHLSIHTCESRPYGVIQLFKNIVDGCIEYVLAVALTLANFENLSVLVLTF